MKVIYAWSSLKSFGQKAWAAVKKLPHWALVLFFTLFALVWWIAQQWAAAKSRAKVREAQLDIDRKLQEELKSARNVRAKDRARLKEKHKQETKKLEQQEAEINEAAKKGPVGIANAWAEYLEGKKK